MNKVVEQIKMLPRYWQLIDGWNLQVFLGPLEEIIIMIVMSNYSASYF